MIHLLRNSFGYTFRRHWPEKAANLKLIYEAASPEAAEQAFRKVRQESKGWSYPAMIRL